MPKSSKGKKHPKKSFQKEFDGWVGEEGAELTEEEKAIAKHQLTTRRERQTSQQLRNSLKYVEELYRKEQAKNDLLVEIQDAPARPYSIPLPTKKGRKNPYVTASNASDLHVEEKVDPATINWRNEYTLEIAEERLETFFQNVVKLYKKEAFIFDVQAHIAWFGGDFFSGHIHEDLIEVGCMTPIQSILWLRPRIKAGLRYWRQEMDCKEIIVPWNFGNHGRDTKKPRVATAAEHNLDWLLGQLIQEDMKDDAGFKFLISPGYHQYVNINGYVIRYHHGDWGTNYAGGIGGITIGLNKAIDAWNKNIHADLDVLGHWHQIIDLPYVIVNGSLVGFNAYALKIRARFEPPLQSFFTVDIERKQKSGFFPVYVTKVGK